MSPQLPWIERRFKFDFHAQLYPELIERLRGTPARLEELVRTLSAPTLTVRLGGAWSIQENVGHLADLEPLFIGRLDDYASGAEELRPADMSNRATEEANHNSRDVNELLGEFRARRQALGARLEGADSRPRPSAELTALRTIDPRVAAVSRPRFGRATTLQLTRK